MNNKKTYDFLAKALANTPEIDTQVASSMQAFCEYMSGKIEEVIEAYKDVDAKPFAVIPKGFDQTMPGLVAVATMALDFYADTPDSKPFYQ